MKNLLSFSCIIFVILGCSLSCFAQKSEEKRFPLFLDTDVGIWVDGGYHLIRSGSVSGSIGYLIQPSHGIGLEARGASSWCCGSILKMRGFGGTYRFSHKGFYAKVSAGKVVRGENIWEYYEGLQYRDDGTYFAVTAEARIWRRFLVGFTYTHTFNMNFDFYKLMDNNDLIYSGIRELEFSAFTISPGLLFN